MRGINRRRSRGFLLAYVLMVVAILSVVAMLLLESARNGAVDARQIEVKNNSFDAAEAGLNAAIESLDRSLSESVSGRGTLPNGFRYQYHIHSNFTGSSSVSIDDPGEGSEGQDDGGGLGQGQGKASATTRSHGDKVAVPSGGAVIVAVGAGPNGERPTTLEAAVTADVAQLEYPHYAIVAGLNIQGTYSPALTVPPSGGGGAAVHANGTITARAGRAFDAKSEASGRTNTLPPGWTRAAQVALPMVSQFDYMVASYKNQASTSSPNTVSVEGGGQLQPTYACGPLPQGQSCLLFYDGSLTLAGAQTSFTGMWTVVINGNLTLSGGGALMFRDKPSLLIVNGNAKITGTGPTTAYLQVKGNTSLGGSAPFTGALMTLGTLTFTDGMSGGFSYDPNVIPPGRAMVGLVKIISYAEY